MSRGPSDAEYEQFVHTAWASLYRTAYLMLGDADGRHARHLPGGRCVATGLSVDVGNDSTVKLGGNSYES